MQASENLVIRTQGLSKTYQGVNALQPLDLQVARHSIFGFLGPNGAGKSTTIKLLLGLSKPTGGSATIFGKDSVRDSVAILNHGQLVAQAPIAQLLNSGESPTHSPCVARLMPRVRASPASHGS